MKDNLCDINIILDRSGSMVKVKEDTIGGFNTFLKEQQSAPGEANITLVQFDDNYEVVYEGKSIKDAQPLDENTFVPRGFTALLDTIGKTINTVGARLAATEEKERPGKVVFVILTDGQENASKEFVPGQIAEMISRQKDTYNWEFIFLGANQNAIVTARGIGIAAQDALSYAANAQGTEAAFASMSGNLVSYRAGLTRGASFSTKDRMMQSKAGVDRSLNKTD